MSRDVKPGGTCPFCGNECHAYCPAWADRCGAFDMLDEHGQYGEPPRDFYIRCLMEIDGGGEQ